MIDDKGIARREKGDFTSQKLRSSLPLLTAMADIFITPWVPTLRGNSLGPCTIVAQLIDDDVRPDPRNKNEVAWTVVGMKETLNKVPKARAAIMETMLAIWRLSERGEDGENDEEWQNHLEAWLVRRERSPNMTSELIIASTGTSLHGHPCGWDRRRASGGRLRGLREGKRFLGPFANPELPQ